MTIHDDASSTPVMSTLKGSETTPPLRPKAKRFRKPRKPLSHEEKLLRQKAMVYFKFPRIVKSDVRRNYDSIVITVSNAYDLLTMRYFLDTYATGSLDISTLVHLPPMLSAQLPQLTTTLTPFELFCILRVMRMFEWPDLTLSIRNTMLLSRAGDERMKVLIDCDMVGTQLWQLPRLPALQRVLAAVEAKQLQLLAPDACREVAERFYHQVISLCEKKPVEAAITSHQRITLVVHCDALRRIEKMETFFIPLAELDTKLLWT